MMQGNRAKSSAWSRVGLGTGQHPLAAGAMLAVGLTLVACRSSDQPGAGDEGAKLERLKTQATSFADRLTKIRARVPPPSKLQHESCPDPAIGKALDGGYGHMLLVDYDYLERYARPELDPYAGERERWKVLTAETLRKIDPPQPMTDVKQVIDTLYRMKKLQERYDYLAVVRGTKRELPRAEGEKFHAGVFKGWLVVFDLGSGQPLCQARLFIQSSLEVVGKTGESRERAVWKDYRGHLRKGLNDAAHRITHRLTLDVE